MRGIKIIERFSPDRPLLDDLIVAVQIEQFDGDRIFFPADLKDKVQRTRIQANIIM